MSRLSSSRGIRAILVVAGLAAAGCGSDTPTTPAAPIAKVAEVFTGTLAVGEVKSHNFQVAVADVAEVTLGSLTVQGQLVTRLVTLGLGTPGTDGCTALTTSQARPGLAYQLGYSVTPGTYCVTISDPLSVLTGTASYTLRVVHP